MTLNPVLHLFEWTQALRQWPVLRLETPPWPASWRALAVSTPTEHVTGFSSEPQADERGRGYTHQPAPSSCEVWGLVLPVKPPASSDEDLDREAGFIYPNACQSRCRVVCTTCQALVGGGSGQLAEGSHSCPGPQGSAAFRPSPHRLPPPAHPVLHCGQRVQVEGCTPELL